MPGLTILLTILTAPPLSSLTMSGPQLRCRGIKSNSVGCPDAVSRRCPVDRLQTSLPGTFTVNHIEGKLIEFPAICQKLMITASAAIQERRNGLLLPLTIGISNSSAHGRRSATT
jgi:hypothetical protein